MKPPPSARLIRWGGVSLLAGAAMATCFAATIGLPSLRGPSTIQFLAYFLLACLAYLTAALRLERDRPPLWVIWGLAILFRLLLLSTSPTLSDDIYRYMWDGHLLNNGVNPYAAAVNSPRLNAYTTPLRGSVNHNEMATPYLPAAEALFAFVERLDPQSTLAFQVTATLLDLATAWLVMDMLGQLRLPRRRVLIYLWNPLVVVEFSHSAHVDVWMILLIMATFWLLSRAEPEKSNAPRLVWASAASLAVATLTKLLPGLLAPIFLRRWKWQRLAFYGIIVSGAIALFAAGAGWGLAGPPDGTGVFGAFRIYLRSWNYNSSFYNWLGTRLTSLQAAGSLPTNLGPNTITLIVSMVSGVLLCLALFAAALLAWRLDDPRGACHTERTHNLLRLAILPLGAYLLLSNTVHPWYVTVIIPLLPFLLPRPGESSPASRFLWPWLYFSIAVVLSYLTYLDPKVLHDISRVRQAEYWPLYLGLLWAAWPYALGGLTWISETAIRLGRMNRR